MMCPLDILADWIKPVRVGVVTDDVLSLHDAFSDSCKWIPSRRLLVNASGQKVSVLPFSPNSLRGPVFDRLLVIVPPGVRPRVCEGVEAAARMACRGGELSIALMRDGHWIVKRFRGVT